jgi:hypothetical protein
VRCFEDEKVFKTSDHRAPSATSDIEMELIYADMDHACPARGAGAQNRQTGDAAAKTTVVIEGSWTR